MATRTSSTRCDFYVYALFRGDTGLPFYIGKGRGERWTDHEQEAAKGAKSHKCAIIRKLQAGGFEIIRVKLHEGVTEDIAHFYEASIIKAIGRGKSGPLANLTDGGEGISGFKMSVESVTKRAANRIGTKRPLKAIAATAEKHRGMKRTPETRANISSAKLARGHKPSLSVIAAASAATRGIKFTEEHREKIAASLRGKTKTAAHKERLAAANRGKTASISARANMSAAQLVRSARIKSEKSSISNSVSVTPVSRLDHEDCGLL